MGNGIPDAVRRACGSMTVPDVETEVQEEDGHRVERIQGEVVCATFDLGRGCRLGYADGIAWIDIPGDLPDVAAIAVVDMTAANVVGHDWLAESTIAEVDRRGPRTRLFLKDAQPNAASHLSFAVI